MNGKTTALKDLQVERVDGVDRPATGRKFVLFKNEGGAQAIIKQAQATQFAAAAVVKALRADASVASLAKSTLVAANGLAQVLGAEAVSKSVPTQPYEYSEPDPDKRGPADEKLGDTTALTMKAEAVKAAEEKPEKPEDEKEMPAFMRKTAEALASLAASQESIAKAISGMPVAVAKGLKAEIEAEAAAERKPAAKPQSKQVQEPERVEKSTKVSFADVLFAK